MDFEDLVDPPHTVLLLVECQNGVIGPDPGLPALAEAADSVPPSVSWPRQPGQPG